MWRAATRDPNGLRCAKSFLVALLCDFSHNTKAKIADKPQNERKNGGRVSEFSFFLPFIRLFVDLPCFCFYSK
jgi:hypothetical protein